MKRPNILFIFSDQQRWDTVGCYGQPGGLRQPWDITPNLDRMAEEGVRFEHAVTCQPVCGPARACLQTGKYATEVGCFRNGIPLPLDQKTMAHYLSDVGYEVGYIGKWHLASWRKHWGEGGSVIDYRTKPVPPSRRGGYKDYWIAADTLEWTSHSYDGYMFNADMEKVTYPKGRYRVDAQTDWVLDYLRSRDGERPFFLFVSYLEPHHQNDHHRYEGPEGSPERFKDFRVPGDLEGADGDWPEQFPDYLGCVASLDGNLGRMRDELVMRGVPPGSVRMETRGRNTYEQAVNIREMLGPAALEEPVHLVTERTHLRRSILCFRKAGFQRVWGVGTYNTAAEADIGAGAFLRYTLWSNLQLQIRVFREVIATAFYKFRGWI